jgi:TetR/AcrR family transcriptional repressor of bet genes
MKCIEKNGLSATTMAQVTREAGLSLGIANLHFESKEKLLVETLRYVTEEYNVGLTAIMEDDNYATTASRIEAVLKFDFSPAIIRRDKLAVWVAFWGESRARPTYQRICLRSDLSSENATGQLFQAAIDEGGYKNQDAAVLASGYTALVDGLWLDLLLCPGHLSRKKARQVARNYLANALPDHISQEA